MKENANPIIHSIIKKEWRRKDPSLSRLQLKHDILKPSSLPNAEERSVYLALSRTVVENTTTSNKDDLSLGILLEAADMSFPDLISKKSILQPLLSLSQSKMNENSSEIIPCCIDLVEPGEIFDIIRNIQDPEHPLTLEQLNVVNLNHISVVDVGNGNVDVDNENQMIGTKEKVKPFSHVDVRFTPTIPHCSMAMLIGLCIRVKLLRSLPARLKVTVRINPGTHASELAINKQLADKERVRAAIENVHLVGVVNRCIANGMIGEGSGGI